MSRTRTLLASIVIVCLSACGQERRAYIIENDPVKNLETFYGDIGEWPYKVQQQRLNDIENGYPRLAVNDNVDVVKGFMGEPDVIDVVYQPDNSDQCITSWLYILEMSRPMTDGGQISSGAVIFFDESGKLIAADAIGMDRAAPIKNIPADAVRYVRYW